MFIEPALTKAAILLRPMLVYEPEQSVDLSESSVFISAGRMDTIVPTRSVERLVQLFESARATVTVKWQAVGHNLVPSELSEAAAWLALQRGTVSASF
jgi:phospholipase/carboxylesterase